MKLQVHEVAVYFRYSPYLLFSFFFQVDPYLPFEFTHEGMLERVSALIQNQVIK